MTRRVRLAAGVAALAPGAFVASIVAASIVTSDYSHVGETVSALGAPGRPHGWVISSGFIAYGALVLPLGYAFAMRLRLAGRRQQGLVLWGLLTVYGTTGLLAGVFRDDAARLSTLEGTAHDALARIGFAAIGLSTFVLPWSVRGLAGWEGATRFSLAMGVLTLAFAMPFQAGVWSAGDGVLQRGFFATTLAWVQVLSVQLARGRLDEGAA